MLEFVFSRKNPEMPVAFASFEAMHTVLEMLLVAPDESLSKQLAEDIFHKTKRLDQLFNRFDANSAIAKLNRRDILVLDEDIYALLDDCESYRKGTLGYFDITVQSRYPAYPPAMPPYRLNEKTNTIACSDSNTQFDLGGIAKGYVLEKIKYLLGTCSIGNALVNFGNSSVLAVGTHPYGACWPVAVEHVMQAQAAAYTFELADNALSVSGLTPQREKHIKNPLTNEYIASEELVAVEGASPLTAEALSTALYAAPANERRHILSNYKSYKAYTIVCEKDGKTITENIG